MYTTEGTLTEWLKQPGSQVKAGEPIITITTEKSTYEVEAPADGVLHAVAQVGAVIPDQGLLGYILAAGESPPAGDAAVAASGVDAAGAGAATAVASGAGADGLAGAGGTASPAGAAGAGAREGLAPRDRAGEAVQADAQGGVRPSGEVRASPVARRLAREQGIDINTLSGTGPGGRIVEADVVAAVSQKASAPAASPQRATTAQERPVSQRIPLIGMRKTIADRLRGSLSTTAPVTLTREVDAESLVAWRESLGKVPYDALLIKIVASALVAHRELNSTIEDEAIVVLGEIHVGFAVAVAGGLLVPVVRDADRRSLKEVVGDVEALAGRAKAGQLSAQDMGGGTFTITNLGAYGVDAFTPIINPPQSAILGVGRILPRAVVRDGQLVARRTCVLSLSFDHRVVDGAPAAQLLDAIASTMNDQFALGRLAG